MKALSVFGLGLAIWGLGLLWPEINKIQMWPVLVGLGLGTGAAVLALLLGKQSTKRPRDKGGTQPSRPVPVMVSR